MNASEIDQPQQLSKAGIRVNSFPPGTGVFFTDPKSTGFNSAMFDILNSANDIQKFIDNKMEQSENDNSSNMSH